MPGRSRVLLLAVVGALGCAGPAWAQAPAPAPAGVADLVYDLDGQRPVPRRLGALDLYRPAAARRRERRPIVVYVHGGAWAVGDKAAVGGKAQLFTDAGYLFASVNYRLSPNPPNLGDPARVRFPDHPRDVGEAVAWLHRNARRHGGDGHRMVLIGHSAGAHLAALVATDRSYLRRFATPRSIVRGFVPLDSGAYEIAEATLNPRPRRRLIFENAFGSAAEEAADPRWAEASLNTHADRRDPPALIVTQLGQRATWAQDYAARLGGAPRAQVLALAKSHAQINAHLGRPGGAADLTPAVLGFVKRVLRRGRPG
jgi:arylformamidase